mmetsp:Transcript_15593/g.14932  ORF Transcript_15593/g.14932 Transcript_15593/m.14932 type:complete len:1139 (-) Transcript_15593:763-4179(-)
MVFPKKSSERGGSERDQTSKEDSTYNLLAMNIIPPTGNSGPEGVTIRKKKSTKSEANEEIVIEPWALNIRNDAAVTNTHGNSNSISTTKYSLLSWLPRSIWEQFRRVANVYFLLISILMFLGTYQTQLFVSPLNPFATVATLVFVLLVTSIKEGMEDRQRSISDKFENTRLITVISFDPANGEIIETIKETQLIKSGDIVKLSGLMPVPVDMVLILTSLHADGNQCYVETSNIDGETNLKLKEAPSLLKSMVTVGEGKPTNKLFMGTLEIEPPNKSIHNFVGALHLNEISDAMALGPENFLLRSSLFSNTDWAYGIAVYTGQETKIQMNNRNAPSKMSKIEIYLNKAIIIIFCAQLTLVVVSIISIYFLGFNHFFRLPYIYKGSGGTPSILPLWLEQFFVFFLLFNNFIPISLYVTIEMVNVGQAFLVAADEEMYDEVLDMPCTVRSSNLVQELGMVSNVFSDKTGTLTRNEMRFVKFIVDGKLYDLDSEGDDDDDVNYIEYSNKIQENDAIEEKVYRKDSISSAHKGMMKSLTDSRGPHQNKVYDFLRCLTTCHTVIREKNGTYRAESPDELALVEGVDKYECTLGERGTSTMNVVMLGEKQTYDILAVNAFNSDRKRMSILLKEKNTGEFFLMCKGADSTMLDLCKMDEVSRKSVDKSLLDLACFGLRTLCIAHKKLSPEAAKAWMNQYKAASTSLQNRAEKMAEAGNEIETGMTLLGITAIEDRLQDQVPEVIADLARAGIVLWMLTGDKEETAINIGHSCNLLLNDTKVFFLTKLNNKEEYATRLEEIFNEVSTKWVSGRGFENEDHTITEMALVMDGPSFEHFQFDDKVHRNWLLKIGVACRSVIGCRLTPIQKQQVVNLVKIDTLPKCTTLSIGDGANDVSMIREADVGVGIFGKEGRQAANNADFAIGQFKFLRRLLLVHGRWNYVRQCKVFLYCMHKNMVITLTLYWFNYYAAMSGVTIYESWVYTGFNFILGLPIIFFGIQDRDISATFALTNPETYATGRTNVYLNNTAIGCWIFNALIFATVICLLFYLACNDSFEFYGLFSMGTMVFTGAVNALQLKVILLHHQWSKIQVFIMFLSVGGMLAYFAIISLLPVSLYEYFDIGLSLLSSNNLYWFYGFFYCTNICYFY